MSADVVSPIGDGGYEVALPATHLVQSAVGHPKSLRRVVCDADCLKTTSLLIKSLTIFETWGFHS